MKDPKEKLNWIKSIPFFAIHLLPLAALWTGVRPADWIACGALWGIRMLFVTVGYHRYFSHRSFMAGRFIQFVLAFGAQSSAQKSAIWWAVGHRHHHAESDTPEDVHPPEKGFWWSHVGWILSSKYDGKGARLGGELMERRMRRMLEREYADAPEIRWLHYWHLVPSVMLGAFVFAIGGLSMLLIGFFLSTVILWHTTFLINSAAHRFGRRRFVTGDNSRNSFLLALICHGEGWHNNHHKFPVSPKQGLYWWEIDMSYYVLKSLQMLKLVKLRASPDRRAIRRALVKARAEKKTFSLAA